VRVLFGVGERAIPSGSASVLFLGATRGGWERLRQAAHRVWRVWGFAHTHAGRVVPRAWRFLLMRLLCFFSCCSRVPCSPAPLFMTLCFLRWALSQRVRWKGRVNQPARCLPLCFAAARSGRRGAHASAPRPLVVTMAVRRQVQLLPLAMPHPSGGHTCVGLGRTPCEVGALFAN